MSAKHFVIEAARTAFMPSCGFRQYDRCCCHPMAWGKKKGLRRARRRVGREMIRKALAELE